MKSLKNINKKNLQNKKKLMRIRFERTKSEDEI
jgi:hypothetical protein